MNLYSQCEFMCWLPVPTLTTHLHSKGEFRARAPESDFVSSTALSCRKLLAELRARGLYEGFGAPICLFTALKFKSLMSTRRLRKLMGRPA